MLGVFFGGGGVLWLFFLIVVVKKGRDVLQFEANAHELEKNFVTICFESVAVTKINLN